MILHSKKYNLIDRKSLILKKQIVDYFLYKTVDSTNLIVERMLQSRDKRYIFIVEAQHQEAGMGRLLSKWYDLSSGTMMFSIYIPSHIIEKTVFQSNNLIKIIEFIKSYFLRIFPNLILITKAPNDLLSVNQEKFLGIMVKRLSNGYILGVGVNISLTELQCYQLMNKINIPCSSLNLLVHESQKNISYKVNYLKNFLPLVITNFLIES